MATHENFNDEKLENENSLNKEDIEKKSEECTVENATEDNFKDQYDSMKDKWIRALADIENLTKRNLREKEESVKYGIVKFSRDVLTVFDNLERAISNIRNMEVNGVVEKILSGLEATLQEFEKIMEKHGIVKVKTIGEKFDPHLHQAVIEVESNEFEPGYIVSVMQDGYVIYDRLLRPAMVTVAKS